MYKPCNFVVTDLTVMVRALMNSHAKMKCVSTRVNLMVSLVTSCVYEAAD